MQQTSTREQHATSVPQMAMSAICPGEISTAISLATCLSTATVATAAASKRVIRDELGVTADGGGAGGFGMKSKSSSRLEGSTSGPTGEGGGGATVGGVEGWLGGGGARGGVSGSGGGWDGGNAGRTGGGNAGGLVCEQQPVQSHWTASNFSQEKSSDAEPHVCSPHGCKHADESQAPGLRQSERTSTVAEEVARAHAKRET